MRLGFALLGSVLGLTAVPAFADVCLWNDPVAAQRAAAMLRPGDLVQLFCAECGDRIARPLTVYNALAAPVPADPVYGEVEVNGIAIDLAYAYVRTAPNGPWTNLGALVECDPGIPGPRTLRPDQVSAGDAQFGGPLPLQPAPPQAPPPPQAPLQATPQAPPPSQPAPGDQRAGVWKISQGPFTGSNGTQQVCSLTGPAVPSFVLGLHVFSDRANDATVTLSDPNWQLGAASRGSATLVLGSAQWSWAFTRSAGNQLVATIPPDQVRPFVQAMFAGGPLAVSVGSQRFTGTLPGPEVGEAFAACTARILGPGNAGPVRDPFAQPAPAAPPAPPAPTRDPFAPR